MAVSAKKKRLSSAEVVERLAMLLCDDPALEVPVQEVYRRHVDADDRRSALRELAVRRGKTLPAWA